MIDSGGDLARKIYELRYVVALTTLTPLFDFRKTLKRIVNNHVRMQRSGSRAEPHPHLKTATKTKDVELIVNSVATVEDENEGYRSSRTLRIRSAYEEIKRDEQGNQAKIKAMSILKRTAIHRGAHLKLKALSEYSTINGS